MCKCEHGHLAKMDTILMMWTWAVATGWKWIGAHTFSHFVCCIATMGLGNKSFSHENRFQQDAESTVNAGFYAEKERGKKQTHTHTKPFASIQAPQRSPAIKGCPTNSRFDLCHWRRAIQRRLAYRIHRNSWLSAVGPLDNSRQLYLSDCQVRDFLFDFSWCDCNNLQTGPCWLLEPLGIHECLRPAATI